MVAIVDPHIKRTPTFPIYAESLDLDIIVKKPDGKTDYEGWCWTGSSVWVDFFHEKSWAWWRGLFRFEKWTVSPDPFHPFHLRREDKRKEDDKLTRLFIFLRMK